ncbi:MAG: holo-[acyl-carrier-protein] synthase [Elusimicrobia bacterium RIFOXYB1_FULL_48_9]|nr:MAG: holo-[acyl-carrier-protein] synthase [Elusimicrobia bacterium RIFOXYB1_FULL_48_9]
MQIGIDIVEIRRIGKLIKNKRFLDRVYTREEIKYCMARVNRSQHFAVRFATKEAVWKALGQRGIAHKDIGVKNNPDGKPVVMIKGRRNKAVDISLSHSDAYAVAVAIVNKRGK